MMESMRGNAVASYPLSPLQEGMLFNQLLDPEAGIDVEQLVLAVSGELDAERLRAAWTTASERHDVLRTSFRWTGDERPVQVVHPGAAVPFAIEDYGTMSAEGRDATVEAAIERERHAGVPLAQAPLQRVRLLRFDGAPAAIVWTFHHAILDGRAAQIVLRDVMDAYAGRPMQPAGPPFRSHIAWLEARDATAAGPFWRSYLAGIEARTPLPAPERPPAASGVSARPGVVISTLDEDATAALTALGRAHGVTLNTLVQAAWALLLARHARTPDVVFGVVRAGRQSGAAGSDGIVGLLINTLPLRVRVDEDAPLAAWLAAVRAQWNALRDVEHTPLRAVAGWSPIATPGGLFDSLVVYERERIVDTVRSSVDPAGTFDLRDIRVVDQTGFPLALSAAGTRRLELRLQFDRRRFERADAERLAETLETILRAFPACAGGTVGDVSGLSPAAARAVAGFNRTTIYPREATVHGLFAERVQRAPAAVAAQLGAETMTYAELAAASDAVAAHLTNLGVGPGAYVGLCVERSFAMLAALLGILKAGAASIGLDPAAPPQRLATMLGDAGVRVVLAHAHLSAALAPALAHPATRAVRVVPIETALERPAEEPFAGPAVAATDPAHVMFTSGSTGTPKGAVLSHRAAVRTVCGTDYLDFNERETFFAFVPLTFDVSILEVWGPLLNGARLVLCPPGLPSLDVLAAAIADGGVTTLWLTTALFEQMVEEQLPRLRGVRQLIVGGDVMSPAHARRALEGLPGTRLVNVYGPTEAAVLITAQPVTAPLAGSIPLGAPIPNATVYVLDERRRPVPVGMPGEVYTGGDGVGNGYINRPDFTAERFVPDPFSARPGATMYRTGDLARWRSDGAIEFLGRLDTQVKIAGVRIEIGEIECALTEHPAVREAAVVAVAARASEKQLVAHVVTRPGTTLGASELHAFLASRLPRQMVPAFFVAADALPLTATGKYDRQALLAAGIPAQPAAGPQTHAPRSAAEITVAAHVAGVLGVADIANKDDFYALGGDSLRAMRLVARLRATFQVDFTIRDLLAEPTVAGITATVVSLERRPERAAHSRVSVLRAGGRGTPIFFLHGDLTGGGFYCRELLPRIDAAHPVYAIDPHGTDGVPPPPVETMARENVRAIRRLHPRGAVILGGFCNGGIVAFEMARQLERAGVRVEHLTIVDAQLPKHVRAPIDAFARRKGRRALEKLGIVQRRDGTLAGASWEAWHRQSILCWYDVLARYAPGKYAGSVSLLWTQDNAAEEARLEAQWRRFVPAIRTGRLPGGHLTTITRHLGETSDIIAAHLLEPARNWDERATAEVHLQRPAAASACYGDDGRFPDPNERSFLQA